MPNVPVPCAAGFEDKRIMLIIFIMRAALPGREGGRPSYSDSCHPDPDQGLVDILSCPFQSSPGIQSRHPIQDLVSIGHAGKPNKKNVFVLPSQPSLPPTPEALFQSRATSPPNNQLRRILHVSAVEDMVANTECCSCGRTGGLEE
jgi:hypothetical protein